MQRLPLNLIYSKNYLQGDTWANHLRRLHPQKENDYQYDDQFDDQYDDLPTEQRIAKEIMTVVNMLDLPMILDRITEGKGNCFPLAILDQCKRPEILNKLPASTKKNCVN